MKNNYALNLVLIISTFAITNVSEARSFSGLNLYFGSVIIEGKVTGLPNPDKKPTIANFRGILEEVSILCVNPGGMADPSNGQPFKDQAVQANNQLSADNIEGRGHGTFSITIPTDQYENSENCHSNNWQPVEGSGIVLSLHGTLKWLECNGEGENPCYDSAGNITAKSKPYDSVDLWCNAPTDFERNSDGTAPTGIAYECEFE